MRRTDLEGAGCADGRRVFPVFNQNAAGGNIDHRTNFAGDDGVNAGQRVALVGPLEFAHLNPPYPKLKNFLYFNGLGTKNVNGFDIVKFNHSADLTYKNTSQTYSG